MTTAATTACWVGASTVPRSAEVSSRRGAYVSLQRRVHGGVSPNAYRPVITVEVRAFWPPYLGHEPEVLDMLAEAIEAAVEKVLSQDQ